MDLLKIVINSGNNTTNIISTSTLNNTNNNTNKNAYMLKNNYNSNNTNNVKANIIYHDIEGYWLYILINAFTLLNPKQNLFNPSSVYEAIYCIKKIKERDGYLAYLAYAEYNNLIYESFAVDKLLKQLLSKYPNKVEGYLRYWQLLIKGKYKNYELSHTISEIYWKNSSTINLDDSIY
jgi:hypothetical protein